MCSIIVQPSRTGLSLVGLPRPWDHLMPPCRHHSVRLMQGEPSTTQIYSFATRICSQYSPPITSVLLSSLSISLFIVAYELPLHRVAPSGACEPEPMRQSVGRACALLNMPFSMSSRLFSGVSPAVCIFICMSSGELAACSKQKRRHLHKPLLCLVPAGLHD